MEHNVSLAHMTNFAAKKQTAPWSIRLLWPSCIE